MLSMLTACVNEEKQESSSQSEQVEPAKAGATEVTIDNNNTTQVYSEAPKRQLA